MSLLILNYSINQSNMLFSHQREVAKELARVFDDVIVVTADPNIGDPLPSVSRVITTKWEAGSRFLSAFRFLVTVLPILLRNRKSVLFSHMTEVQSALIAPFCRLLGIRHYLWYAHTSNSLYLRLCFPFLSGVITSTKGSCPISGRKVYPIGQGVKSSMNESSYRHSTNSYLNWYHVSRIAPSKRIELIVKAIHQVRLSGVPLTLDIFGIPSDAGGTLYQEQLLAQTREYTKEGWLKFRGKLDPTAASETIRTYDGFIHAFQGSLDKTLVEASLARNFVVTVNKEYLNAFKVETSSNTNDLESLVLQLHRFIEMPAGDRILEVERRWSIASSDHSIKGFIDRLVEVLSSDKK